jgi:hypothetical protein
MRLAFDGRRGQGAHRLVMDDMVDEALARCRTSDLDTDRNMSHTIRSMYPRAENMKTSDCLVHSAAADAWVSFLNTPSSIPPTVCERKSRA